MSQHSIKIAIAGVGTVGNGVLDLLLKNKVIEKLEEKGKETKKKFGLDNKDIESIFDLLEKENPDL